MDVAPNITGYDYTRGGTTFDYLAFDADYEFKVYFWTVDPVTGGITYWRKVGSATASTMAYTPFGSWTGASDGDHGWYVGDFDGDGADDIFRYLGNVTGADVWLSTGAEFAHL